MRVTRQIVEVLGRVPSQGVEADAGSALVLGQTAGLTKSILVAATVALALDHSAGAQMPMELSASSALDLSHAAGIGAAFLDATDSLELDQVAEGAIFHTVEAAAISELQVDSTTEKQVSPGGAATSTLELLQSVGLTLVKTLGTANALQLSQGNSGLGVNIFLATSELTLGQVFTYLLILRDSTYQYSPAIGGRS
jgi:hypothetical protein